MKSHYPDYQFGTEKRDWTTLYRVVMFILVACGTGMMAVVVYSADAYVREKAETAASRVMIPMNVRIGEMLLKASYDSDQRDTSRRLQFLEMSATENRSKIETNQREVVNDMHRLELMLREGFTKQGVQLTVPPKR